MAIPLSLVAAAVLLGRVFHFTLNTMTLGGFAVALGVLVDDAISASKTSEAPAPERGGGYASAAARCRPRRHDRDQRTGALRHDRGAGRLRAGPGDIGRAGAIRRPLAIAFMLSVLASLIVALTVTPALSALLHRPKRSRRAALDYGAERFSDTHDRSCRSPAGAGRRHIGALFVGALIWLAFMGGQFMPDFREGHFVVQVNSSVPGTSLDEMMALGRRISRDILALPSVATVEQQLGRSEGAKTYSAPSAASSTSSSRPTPRPTRPRFRINCARFWPLSRPQCRVVTFLGDRLSESLTGETAAEVVNIFGDDLDALDKIATSVGDTLGKVPGVVDLQVQHAAQTPAIAIALQPEALAAYGLKAQEVLDTLQAAYAGATVGQTYAGCARSMSFSSCLTRCGTGSSRSARSRSAARLVRCRCAISRASSRPKGASPFSTRKGSGAYR